MDAEVRAEVLALSSDFPAVWNHPHTTPQDRKRLIRLLIEDVTLSKAQGVTLQVRFRGGATQTLTIAATRPNWQTWETPPEVITAIDELLNEHTNRQVANLLNERGYHSGKGKPFRPNIVGNIRRVYGLQSRYERLRAQGLLTSQEMAERLGIDEPRVRIWRKAGLLHGYVIDDRNQYLYEPPGEDAPSKCQGRKLSKRCRFLETEIVSQRVKEVQYES